MPDSPTIIPPNYSDSPEKAAFILAEQGTLEIIELMGAADRLKSAGLKDQTIALYRLWLEHTTSPLSYVANFNLGVELASDRAFNEAEAVYRTALEQSPDFIRARLNLGNCLEQQKREDEALEQWRLALQTESIHLPENLPLQLHALNNLGRLFEIKKNYKDSLANLEDSFALDPTQRDVLLHLVHLIQKVCRWPVFAPPKGITKEEMINGTSPLAMLAASDDPKLQLAAAQQFIAHKYPETNTEPLAPRGGYRHEKIRIGYLSSDFCLHAVSLLMVELLELHDHGQFEVYGFCWSRVDDTSIQRRVQKSMDHFIKIGEMGDKEAAECIRSHEIDIMVDLQGLTSGARPLILSYRPAVLQMTYLGFPGTTGLPWIDYVISDPYLIPEELAPFHTEKPLYMPNCFQSSDSKREVGPMPTRADNGLPVKAFVFCSFNNNYKFTPEVFAAWMRIIKRVPGSVFWLLADNDWSKENLLKEAKKLGVKKERLIFAPRVAPADYLARYQLADLFLDTFPFNGGTTANDALFMGLPLLTLSGRTFASRMAGSLLTHLELPELITTNLKEYEEKAVRLAKKPAELKVLKNRLMENKISGSVFDISKFVKGYENSIIESLRKHESVKPLNVEEISKQCEYKGGATSNPLKIYCVGHTRPIFDARIDFTMLCPSPIGMPREIVIEDTRFGHAVDGASLAEYSQLFGLYELISAGDIVADNLFLFQYRKFLSPTWGGGESKSSWVRVVRPEEGGSLFPALEQIEALPAGIVVGSLLKLGESISSNYARAHVIEDMVMFTAACAKCKYLTAEDIRAFATFRGLIPSPGLCYIKTETFMKIMTILKDVCDEFLRNYHVKREGYQRRVVGYLLERLHSYLLCKWLQDGSEPTILIWNRYVVTND